MSKLSATVHALARKLLLLRGGDSAGPDRVETSSPRVNDTRHIIIIITACHLSRGRRGTNHPDGQAALM